MTRAELVETWRRSVSVMHIAPHVTAARYAHWHLGLGVAATGLAAIVGLTKLAADAGPAALTGAAAFLKLDERAARHGKAAADFQGLRREMDEELVKLAEGRSSKTTVRSRPDGSRCSKRLPLCRGVFKAPANETLRGALALEFDIDDETQKDLRVNVIRSFPGRGIRVWGARTRTSNALWK